jgi:hypothetical protein
MPATIDFQSKRDKRDAHRYRLARAQHLLDLFAAARGRPAQTMDELEEFLTEEQAAGRIPKRPA